jgi:hypothetical protein
MLEDYPAAHSMDTDWFAVDQHGHVALLRSGDEGAVPEAYSGPQFGRRELAFLWRASVPFDPLGLPQDSPGQLLREASSEWELLSDPQDYGYEHMLLRLAHPRAVELVPGGHRLQTERDLYAWAHQTPLEALRRLLARGWVHQAWIFLDFPLERFGVYLYRAPYRHSWIFPYRRTGTPRIPLTSSVLTSTLLSQASVLPQVSFARDELVQPLEFVPCRGRGLGWIDSQGQPHHF